MMNSESQMIEKHIGEKKQAPCAEEKEGNVNLPLKFLIDNQENFVTLKSQILNTLL